MARNYYTIKRLSRRSGVHSDSSQLYTTIDMVGAERRRGFYPRRKDYVPDFHGYQIAKVDGAWKLELVGVETLYTEFGAVVIRVHAAQGR